MIEAIAADGIVLAYIVANGDPPDQTRYLTPDEVPLQLGYVVYRAGQEIPRHVHLPVERHLVGTAEVLIVQRGRCSVDIYTDDRRLVETRELGTGDIMIAVTGGHGFRATEDLVLLEIKQGPYSGTADKERF
jgi:mannose-6-phosphate isomerase-like protein (cupin superfamily)